MNLLYFSRLLARRTTRRPVLLPRTACVSVPAGLDWVIRQRLTSVIAAQLLSDDALGSVESLTQLDEALGMNGRLDIHQARLYGFEVSVYYSFLLRQERSYEQWRSGLVPDRARLVIQGQLRLFLTQLRTVCLNVDVYAARPLPTARPS